MLHIDFEAETEKDAVQLALESLGLTINDITYETIQKEKKGVFGIGKKDKAIVRIFYKEKNEINQLVDDIKKIITLIDPTCQIEVSGTPEEKLTLSVESSDSSHLIGRNGQNLHAIQTIVNSALLKHGNKYRILVDIDHYYSRKEQTLVEKAIEAANQVLETKKPAYLAPMNPFERRLVHMELKKIPGITTHSEGGGHLKKIRIVAQGQANESAPSQVENSSETHL
jgi:spoIIIJ-associated protein